MIMAYIVMAYIDMSLGANIVRHDRAFSRIGPFPRTPLDEVRVEGVSSRHPSNLGGPSTTTPIANAVAALRHEHYVLSAPGGVGLVHQV